MSEIPDIGQIHCIAPRRKVPAGATIVPMQTIEFVLNREHVELCQLLKLAGIAPSGGIGKRMVAAGEVSVDGKPESRKTAKIRAGQTVRCAGVTVLVKAP